MTRITIFLNKSLEENAGIYYEEAKRCRAKMKGASESIERMQLKISQLEQKKEKILQKEKEKKENRKKEWFEKFRWFISSDGFLVIGGRDATTNEIIIKKHAEKNDLVFHTDIAGSPFFVVKSNGKEIPKTTIEETATAVAVFSRAWKLGIKSIDVFYVNPEQVTKQAKAGEYLQKGSFMIYGKKNYITPDLNIGIGVYKDDLVMAGPISAVKKNCKSFVVLQEGKEKLSSVAKQIQKKIGCNIDDIIKALPSGNIKIKQ